MSKRGSPFPTNDPNGRPENGFAYGTSSLTPDDPPQKATQARLAARKMAQPKRRAGSRPPTSGSSTGNAFAGLQTPSQSFPVTQPPAQNNNIFASASFPPSNEAQAGAFTSNNFNFAGASGGAGFNNPFASANANTNSTPAMNGTGSSVFSTPAPANQTSSFNFSQNNSSAAAPTFTFGANTSTPTQNNFFASKNNEARVYKFGQSNNGQETAAAPSSGFKFGSNTPSTTGSVQFGQGGSTIFGQSQAPATSSSDAAQPVSTGNAPSIFANAQPSLFAPKPAESQPTATAETPKPSLFAQSSSQPQTTATPSAPQSTPFKFGSQAASPATTTPVFNFGSPNPSKTDTHEQTPSPTEDAMHTSPDFQRTTAKSTESTETAAHKAAPSLASAAPLSNLFGQATQEKSKEDTAVAASKEQNARSSLFSSSGKPTFNFSPSSSTIATASTPSAASQGITEAPADKPSTAPSLFATTNATPAAAKSLFTPATPQPAASQPFASKPAATPGIFGSATGSVQKPADSQTSSSAMTAKAPSFSFSAATQAAKESTSPQKSPPKRSDTQRSLSSGELLFAKLKQPTPRLNEEQKRRFKRTIAFKALNSYLRDLIDGKQEYSDLSTMFAWYQQSAADINAGRDPTGPSEFVVGSAPSKSTTKRKGSELTREGIESGSAMKRSRLENASSSASQVRFGAAQKTSSSSTPNGAAFSTGSPVKKSARDNSTRTPGAFSSASNPFGNLGSNKRKSPEVEVAGDAESGSASKRSRGSDSATVKLFESALAAKKDQPLQSSIFGTPSASSSRGTSIFDDTAQRSVTSSNNIFGHIGSQAMDGSDKENQGDDTDEDDDADADDVPSKEAPKIASTSNGGSDSETSGRSLMSRTTLKPTQDAPTDVASDAPSADTQSNPFRSSLGGDQTWKTGSPIKFAANKSEAVDDESASAQEPNAKETASPTPLFNFTGPSPTGTPKAMTPFSFSATKPTGSIFSNISSATPASGPPKFNFGGASVPTGSQLSTTANTPFSFQSLNTSRASTPGLSAGETSAPESSAAEGEGEDDTAPKLEQMKDLCDLTEKEREEEEVLFEALKSKARILEKKTTEWQTKGNGPLRILKNKSTGNVRLLMRQTPSGRVILNVSLPANMSAKATGKNATLPLVVDGDLSTWYITMGAEDPVKELVNTYNECTSKA